MRYYNTNTITSNHSSKLLISDHHLLTFNIPVNKPSRPLATINYRKINNINIDFFYSDFLQLYINSKTHLNSSSLYTSLHVTLNEYAPIKTKKIILRNSFKWFTPGFMLSKRKFWRFEQIWRKLKSSIHLNQFKLHMKVYRKLLLLEKQNYYKKQFRTEGKKLQIIFESLMNFLVK